MVLSNRLGSLGVTLEGSFVYLAADVLPVCYVVGWLVVGLLLRLPRLVEALNLPLCVVMHPFGKIPA